jgi:hypothetical protein
MKRRLCCLVFISVLLVSISAPLIVSAEPKDVTNDLKGFVIHVDASAVLRELGYTEKNMSSVPRKLMIQIIRSYDESAVRHDDGDYYATITPDSPRAEVNLIGSDRISPVDVDLSHAPDSHEMFDANGSSGGFLDSDDRACLVFAIWDYPGVEIDVAGVEDVFDDISDWISSTSAYDYWNFLTNSECTYYYIYNWITWACAEYDNVDVYWIGHGITFLSDGVPTTAFISHNAWDDEQGVLLSQVYLADDFETGTYDYSTLRVGVGSFCYAWGFEDTFMDPGGSISHNRAFIGTDTEITLAYAAEYVDTWGEVWYDDYEGSAYAHSEADDVADIYLGQGQNPFNYDDISGSIWFR